MDNRTKITAVGLVLAVIFLFICIISSIVNANRSPEEWKSYCREQSFGSVVCVYDRTLASSDKCYCYDFNK